MVALGGYSTGTISIGAGATAAVGTSTIWNNTNARAGDTLIVAGHQVLIEDVTDTSHLVIDAWPFTAVSTGTTYKIAFTSPLRYGANAQLAKDTSDVLAVLNTSGYFVFVDAALSVPDPSLGEDNQFALQASTKKLWFKTGGIWNFYGYFSGFGIPAPYDNAHTYNLFDVATSAGSSYMFVNTTPSAGHVPPNATYWAVLASKGDQGTQGDTAGINLTYSSTTADADPGTGIFRLNNATPASATAAYIDNTQVGGGSITSILDTFDDSTNTVKGYIRFEKTTDPTVWAMFLVTGSVVDGTGYRKLTLSSGAGSGAFTNGDSFAMTFFRAGNQGIIDLTFLRGYLSGLTLSTAGASSSFGIAAGVAVDSTQTDFMKLTSAITKTTAAWSAGSGNGGLDTGTIANGTWYHAYLIKNPTTNVVDVLISLSATSPTMPSGFTLFRRIGSLGTTGSAQWIKFIQDGDVFAFDVPILDVQVTNPGTAAVLRTLSVPSGVNVFADVTGRCQPSTDAAVILSDPAIADTAPSNYNGIAQWTGNSTLAPVGRALIRTNTASQIRVRQNNSGAGEILNIYTRGWVDRLGR